MRLQVGKSKEKGKSECGGGRKREVNSSKVPQKTEKRTCAHADVLGLYRRVRGRNRGTLSKTWRTKKKSTGESRKNERKSARLSLRKFRIRMKSSKRKMRVQ